MDQPKRPQTRYEWLDMPEQQQRAFRVRQVQELASKARGKGTTADQVYRGTTIERLPPKPVTHSVSQWQRPSNLKEPIVSMNTIFPSQAEKRTLDEHIREQERHHFLRSNEPIEIIEEAQGYLDSLREMKDETLGEIRSFHERAKVYRNAIDEIERLTTRGKVSADELSVAWHQLMGNLPESFVANYAGDDYNLNSLKFGLINEIEDLYNGPEYRRLNKHAARLDRLVSHRLADIEYARTVLPSFDPSDEEVGPFDAQLQEWRRFKEELRDHDSLLETLGIRHAKNAEMGPTQRYRSAVYKGMMDEQTAREVTQARAIRGRRWKVGGEQTSNSVLQAAAAKGKYKLYSSPIRKDYTKEWKQAMKDGGLHYIGGDRFKYRVVGVNKGNVTLAPEAAQMSEIKATLRFTDREGLLDSLRAQIKRRDAAHREIDIAIAESVLRGTPGISRDGKVINRDSFRTQLQRANQVMMDRDDFGSVDLPEPLRDLLAVHAPFTLSAKGEDMRDVVQNMNAAFESVLKEAHTVEGDLVEGLQERIMAKFFEEHFERSGGGSRKMQEASADSVVKEIVRGFEASGITDYTADDVLRVHRRTKDVLETWDDKKKAGFAKLKFMEYGANADEGEIRQAFERVMQSAIDPRRPSRLHDGIGDHDRTDHDQIYGQRDELAGAGIEGGDADLAGKTLARQSMEAGESLLSPEQRALANQVRREKMAIADATAMLALRANESELRNPKALFESVIAEVANRHGFTHKEAAELVLTATMQDKVSFGGKSVAMLGTLFDRLQKEGQDISFDLAFGSREEFTGFIKDMKEIHGVEITGTVNGQTARFEVGKQGDLIAQLHDRALYVADDHMKRVDENTMIAGDAVIPTKTISTMTMPSISRRAETVEEALGKLATPLVDDDEGRVILDVGGKFDALNRLGWNQLSSNPASTLQNMEALRQGTQGIVMDLETTGFAWEVKGKRLADSLVHPTEIAYSVVNWKQNDGGIGELAVETSERILVKPSSEVRGHVKRSLTRLEKLAASGADDQAIREFLNDQSGYYLRNVAKYGGGNAVQWGGQTPFEKMTGAELVEKIKTDAMGGLDFLNENGVELPEAMASLKEATRGRIIIGQNFADADARWIKLFEDKVISQKVGDAKAYVQQSFEANEAIRQRADIAWEGEKNRAARGLKEAEAGLISAQEMERAALRTERETKSNLAQIRKEIKELEAYVARGGDGADKLEKLRRREIIKRAEYVTASGNAGKASEAAKAAVGRRLNALSAATQAQSTARRDAIRAGLGFKQDVHDSFETLLRKYEGMALDDAAKEFGFERIDEPLIELMHTSRWHNDALRTRDPVTGIVSGDSLGAQVGYHAKGLGTWEEGGKRIPFAAHYQSGAHLAETDVEATRRLAEIYMRKDAPGDITRVRRRSLDGRAGTVLLNVTNERNRVVDRGAYEVVDFIDTDDAKGYVLQNLQDGSYTNLTAKNWQGVQRVVNDSFVGVSGTKKEVKARARRFVESLEMEDVNRMITDARRSSESAAYQEALAEAAVKGADNTRLKQSINRIDQIHAEIAKKQSEVVGPHIKSDYGIWGLSDEDRLLLANEASLRRKQSGIEAELANLSGRQNRKFEAAHLYFQSDEWKKQRGALDHIGALERSGFLSKNDANAIIGDLNKAWKSAAATRPVENVFSLGEAGGVPIHVDLSKHSTAAASLWAAVDQLKDQAPDSEVGENARKQWAINNVLVPEMQKRRVGGRRIVGENSDRIDSLANDLMRNRGRLKQVEQPVYSQTGNLDKISSATEAVMKELDTSGMSPTERSIVDRDLAARAGMDATPGLYRPLPHQMGDGRLINLARNANPTLWDHTSEELLEKAAPYNSQIEAIQQRLAAGGLDKREIANERAELRRLRKERGEIFGELNRRTLPNHAPGDEAVSSDPLAMHTRRLLGWDADDSTGEAMLLTGDHAGKRLRDLADEDLEKFAAGAERRSRWAKSSAERHLGTRRLGEAAAHSAESAAKDGAEAARNALMRYAEHSGGGAGAKGGWRAFTEAMSSFGKSKTGKWATGIGLAAGGLALFGSHAPRPSDRELQPENRGVPDSGQQVAPPPSRGGGDVRVETADDGFQLRVRAKHRGNLSGDHMANLVSEGINGSMPEVRTSINVSHQDDSSSLTDEEVSSLFHRALR